MAAAAGKHVIWESETLVAYLHPRPWTPGATVLTQKAAGGPGSLFHLAEGEFLGLMMAARVVGSLLCERLGVRRCAVLHRPAWPNHGPPRLRLLPLYGLQADWQPHLAPQEEFVVHDPGYCTSKSGPRWDSVRLEALRDRIRAKLPEPGAAPSYAFHGEDPEHPGLFSRIVRGEEQQWRVWEDRSHVAFLTPFPNTPGLTVLVPRRPLTSDVLRLEELDYRSLVLASRRVAQLLEKALGSWAVALIFEGFEIDYAHAKLIPLTKAEGEGSGCLACPSAEFHSEYPGYVTSVDGPPASLETLKEMQAKITLV
ncbi:uncharacterized protein LOC114786281 isoform X2 [Denticeps clupeoides]|nr:uncharacterized protein LOC114786281 isoform X2 [Denticeps clupeoides]